MGSTGRRHDERIPRNWRRVPWEAHFAWIEREYCQIEKLVNLLYKIPHPTGFKVACFPIKVQGASGGWCRPVAFV